MFAIYEFSLFFLWAELGQLFLCGVPLIAVNYIMIGLLHGSKHIRLFNNAYFIVIYVIAAMHANQSVSPTFKVIFGILFPANSFIWTFNRIQVHEFQNLCLQKKSQNCEGKYA